MNTKHITLIALGTGGLLLIPLLANFPWTASDFIAAFVLIFVTGVLIDTVWNKAGKYRIVAAGIIAFLFVWLWAELAVGVFTNWGS